MVERKKRKPNPPLTHCRNGHPYIERNYKMYRGHRWCLLCLKRNWADTRRRHPLRYKKYYNKEKRRLEEKERRKNNKESYRKSEEKRKQTDNYFIKTYRRNAKYKNLLCTISDEEIMKLVRSACFYCGQWDCRGIDRVDNLKGYEEGNCRPCCFICNRAKMDTTQDEFKDFIKRVAIHWLGAKFEI